MEQEISKIDAAIDQLGWATRLFLDQKAYIAAITLAVAAEEILGKVLAEPSAHKILKEKLAAEFEMDEKIVSDSIIPSFRLREQSIKFTRLRESHCERIDERSEPILRHVGDQFVEHAALSEQRVTSGF